MRFGQAVKMALKSILAKKGRSFLTMLGIIIGIASVMTIVATVDGYNRKMMEAFEAQGTNKITVSLQLNSGESGFEKIYNYCMGIEEAIGVTPSGEIGGTIKYGAKTSDTMDWKEQPRVVLGSDQYSLCNNFTLARGRDLSSIDVEKYHQVCVLGARAARTMFDYADPLNQSLMINGVPFQVVGVYAEKDKSSGYSMDSVIVVPYTAQRFLPNAGGGGSNECVVKVKDSQSIGKVINTLQAYIDSLTQSGSRGWGYAYSEQQWQEESNNMLTMISVVLGSIAGISLLVGGIGIMNIMLVTVTERTREIGIRRAIGAERSSIVVQFLVESAMICGIGGIIGIAIGYGGTHLAGVLLGNMLEEEMSLYPSPTITLEAFTFSVSLGVLFGMYPAIKASGLQPVVALRSE